MLSILPVVPKSSPREQNRETSDTGWGVALVCTGLWLVLGTGGGQANLQEHAYEGEYWTCVIPSPSSCHHCLGTDSACSTSVAAAHTHG